MSLAMTIIKSYRSIFAREIFHKFNRMLYHCSLRGLGVLNYESDAVSGENYFANMAIGKKSHCIVMDIGANKGQYARKILAINSTATVYAFEPHPRTFQLLLANNPAKNIIPVNAAVGSHKGEAPLYDYESQDGSQHASMHKHVIEHIHGSPSVSHPVSMITLDDYCRDNNIDEIDLLKIDTEGNEMDALRGAENLIKSRKIKSIQFEFNSMNVSSRTFMSDFNELLTEYDIYRLLPSGMIPLSPYDSALCEIFAYQNIVALLKG